MKAHSVDILDLFEVTRSHDQGAIETLHFEKFM